MVRLALLMLLLATILGLLAALQNAPVFSMTMLAAVSAGAARGAAAAGGRRRRPRCEGGCRGAKAAPNRSGR